jgi:hypothetical protein
MVQEVSKLPDCIMMLLSVVKIRFQSRSQQRQWARAAQRSFSALCCSGLRTAPQTGKIS